MAGKMCLMGGMIVVFGLIVLYMDAGTLKRTDFTSFYYLRGSEEVEGVIAKKGIIRGAGCL